MYIKDFLKKLILKSSCINCGRNNKNSFCLSCINQLQKIPENHCGICQSTSFKDNQCLECLRRTEHFIKLSSIGVYNGLLKNIIYDYKYQSMINYSQPLSYLLSESLKNSLPIKKINIITSIPLHKDKLKKRGFNQSELLARDLSKILNIKYCEVFGRTRDTKPQFSLNLKERQENLDSAFEIIYPKIKSKTILIIDDIFTTGATIQECCKIVTPFTNQIYVAVLARTLN